MTDRTENKIGRNRAVVMGSDSCFESCEFESQHRILDRHFLHKLVIKFVMFVLKDRKLMRKRGGDGPFKKIGRKERTRKCRF